MVKLIRDTWFSERLGVPCASLKLNGDIESSAVADALEAFGHGRGMFAFAKAATSDLASCAALEEVGFHIVDTMVTLTKPFGAPAPKLTNQVRFAEEGDAQAVEEVARKNFTYSRLHLDPGIPNRIANEVKAQWAGNYFKGERGDSMVVCEMDGEVEGFLQLLVRDDAMVIDLVGVSTKVRGTGLARDMIRFAENNIEPRILVRVGTQAANIPSLRFYQKYGFKVESSSHVFHYHGEDIR